MKKSILVFAVALMGALGATKAQAQLVYNEVFTFTSLLTPTQLQVNHYTLLHGGNHTVSHTFIGAVGTDIVYVNTLSQAWADGLTNYVDNVPVVPGTLYRFCIFGSDSVTEIAPWTVYIEVYVPALALVAAVHVSDKPVAVYPNPVATSATIRCMEWEGIVFQLFDMSGRLVREVPATSETTVFSKGDLPAGSYIVTDGKNKVQIILQ